MHGAYLARSVAQLTGSDRFEEWVAHVRTALPDIDRIRTVRRDEDKHRYLLVKYKNGVEVPSWMVSDGTLRLLALTLLAYVPEFTGTYLIEEPENGVVNLELGRLRTRLSGSAGGHNGRRRSPQRKQRVAAVKRHGPEHDQD